MAYGNQKKKSYEDAFAAKYDSELGQKIRNKNEGNPMMGAATEKHGKFISEMTDHREPQPQPDRFRDRPEIASMRQRFYDYRDSKSGSESAEQMSKRLKRQRGG